MQGTVLFSKVHGCLLGGAIGDALGGPVELWSTERIRQAYGNLDHFVPFDREPSFHGQFRNVLGAYTDDTRLKHLLCKAILIAGGKPRPGDIGHVLAEAYHRAPDTLHEGFVEEYYYKAIWGRDKVIFSGEPTNGAIMANSPLGLICACRPDEAYQLGFDLAFFTDGHAKTAAAMMVAAIAEAMRPSATVNGIVEAARAAHMRFARRREGEHWHTTAWRYDPNLRFLDQALVIARRERDVFAIREPLMELLEWGHLFSDSIHTLIVALSMFVASEGDFRRAVIGALMYGRDKDSYASVAGALAGAYRGAEAIPKEWGQPVVEGNPEVDMHALARQLTDLITTNYRHVLADMNELGTLL